MFDCKKGVMFQISNGEYIGARESVNPVDVKESNNAGFPEFSILALFKGFVQCILIFLRCCPYTGRSNILRDTSSPF